MSRLLRMLELEFSPLLGVCQLINNIRYFAVIPIILT